MNTSDRATICVRAYQGGVLVREVRALAVDGIETDRGGWNLIATVNRRVVWRFPMGRCAMAFDLAADPEAPA